MRHSILALFMALWLAGTVAPAGAADWNWTLTSGNSTVALDGSAYPGSSPGVYSWLFDNAERMNQQAFYYRIGTTSPEYPVGGDALDPSALFTVAVTNQTASSVTLAFTEKAGRFRMEVTYGLNGGTAGTGRSTLTKTVVITNLASSPLDFHLFSYSDYDLKTGPDLYENTAIVNGKAYQSSFATASDTVGSGTTLVEHATVPPSRYGVDITQFLGSLANGTTPYDLDNFAGPYAIPGGAFDNGDKQFALQWDLTIDPATPTLVTITDEFYPTKALYLSKSTPGTCISYGQTITSTYTFDNTQNASTPITNVQVSEKLPQDISLVSATNGGTYDAATGTVNWSIPQLTAGAPQQTVQGTYLVNSAVDFTMTSRLVGDEAFPSGTSATLPLCNHPPVIASVTSNSGFAVEAQPASWQINASDQDPGATLSYALAKAPPGMTVSPAGVISWTPVSPFVGNVPVTIEVGDGALTTAKVVSLYVYAGPHLGDLNQDGQVTVADVLEVLKVAVKQKPVTPAALAEGDVSPLVNGKPAPDGEITIQDVLLILKKALKLVTWQ